MCALVFPKVGARLSLSAPPIIHRRQFTVMRIDVERKRNGREGEEGRSELGGVEGGGNGGRRGKKASHSLLMLRRETEAKLLGPAKVSGSRLRNMTKDGGGGSWRWENQVAF